VVGTLALAIGTIAAVFTVLDRVVISPLPYGHPDRLVFVAAEAPGSEMTGEFGPAAEFYLQYKEGLAPARGRRDLRYLHQLAPGRRPRRAGPDGGGHELPVLDAGRAARARPPARGFG